MHDARELSLDIESYLKAQENKGLLRFITCGSVDDGKSTLIGRLLYDSKLIFEDQLASLESDSRKIGTQGEKIDFALLVDGLQSEREQGITIDVAYRFFATDKRKFIVADTPGHEQYTRNMATGASNAEVAVLLIDARKGILTQTRRHSYIVSLLGIRHIVLAVNKMDLVGYEKATFDRIVQEYKDFAGRIGLENVTAIPMSALEGDNVIARSERMAWFDGPSILQYLETVQVVRDASSTPFRMPVQWVNRPNLDFRGFSGTIVGGKIRKGDAIAAYPSARESRVERIVTMDGDLEEAAAGQSVTLTLEDEIDISRGDVIATKENPPAVADQFQAHVIWMADEAMYPGRRYMIKVGCQSSSATVTDLKYKVNVNTLEHQSGKELHLNEAGVCNFSSDKALVFDAYAENRDMGGFIIIDRFTNNTVGVGMIDFALRRATNLVWQKTEVDREARSALKDQKPVIVWFTGLSGAGKSTIANLVEKKLNAMGRHTYILDGDNVRHGLNKDLGFTDADRVENIRRVGEVSKLFVDAGLIVLVSFISPFRSERRMVRDMVGEGEFIEVYIDTPIEVCEERDPKGLYAKARGGQIKNFTGIDSAYEPPENPEIVLRGAGVDPESNADRIVAHLLEKGIA